MKLFFFLALLSSAILLGTDCKDKPPIIPPDNYIPPDTTSQNFTISTWEFGKQFTTSYATDAWVFNKNNIWVVGLFQGIDSTNPQHYTDANIIRWDGTSWKPFNPFIAYSSGINSLFAVDTSLIYFADIGLTMYKNGVFNDIDLTQLQFSSGQSIDYVWASNENNVWGVGAQGMVVFYDGTVWKNLSVSADYQLVGITGSKKTGVAYAVGRNTKINEYVIVKLDHGNTSILFATTLAYVSFNDVDMLNEETLLLCGTAVFTYSLSTGMFNDSYYGQSIISRIPYHFDAIAVAAPNDVFIFGHNYINIYNKVYATHYNGARFGEELLLTGDISWYKGASARDGVAVFTMWSQQKALLFILRRN
ncbi:MAG: hypothetical protein PHP42_13840 [Bacteroidota bacterium]|nr:hypothetical protein [Bacteroidota bacterium]